tara:strand:+ start:3189 stop:4034 length:846 start_codon:yes stop_codon:yes gene_type:complete
MSFISNIFGGGSSAPQSTPASQTQYVREAPGIEERKLELMDIARQVAQQPVNIPDVKTAPLSVLEQRGIQTAGTTGIGTPTTAAGIGQILSAAQAPNISQFFNPFQQYVTDEINRQAQMGQNQLSAQAVRSGAFGGGREGVQRAEQDLRRLEAIGRSRAQGFQTALGAAQNQQRVGLAAGQQLGALGQQQADMARQDINQLLAAGGLERQLAQQALDAQRATQLQQAYEPFQRTEFLKNIYAAGPTSQSQITMATAPTAAPLAQSIGTGLGAFQAFSGIGG